MPGMEYAGGGASGPIEKKDGKKTKEFSRGKCFAEIKKMINVARDMHGKKLLASIGGCAGIFVLVDIVKAQMQGYLHPPHIPVLTRPAQPAARSAPLGRRRSPGRLVSPDPPALTTLL